MFLSLDFLYVPAPDFEATLESYTRVLGAKLLWKVRGMGTIVAGLQLSERGPALLLSEHLKGDVPVLVYRVASYEESLRALRSGGFEAGEELEIPHGPCFSFHARGGQRFAIYELIRPEANEMFHGRNDA